jgi:hypothetical protein
MSLLVVELARPCEQAPADSAGRDSMPRILCMEELSRSRKKPAGRKGYAMAYYLISFPSDAMDQIPKPEMPDVGRAAHAVCQEAISAGVYVIAGGLEDQPASIVATDGTVTEGPRSYAFSGITIVDVPSRQEALKWAVKFAAACRCPQDVREIGLDPELDTMLSEAAS